MHNLTCKSQLELDAFYFFNYSLFVKIVSSHIEANSKIFILNLFVYLRNRSINNFVSHFYGKRNIFKVVFFFFVIRMLFYTF